MNTPASAARPNDATPIPSADQASRTPSAYRSSVPSIALLVLGITGLVIFPLGLIFGLPAFILGLIGLKKKSARKGVAIAGLVCVGVAVLFSPIALVFCPCFPPIQPSRIVADHGKEIVMAIVSANFERAADMHSEFWPVSGRWHDSNEYFANLMDDGDKTTLTGIFFSNFAGGGVDSATDMEEFKRKGNIWTMLAGIGTCNDSRMPFIWTRNLHLTQADLEDYVRNPGVERSLAHRLDPSVEPFGDNCVVMITKGAKTFTIKASDLTTKTFFGGALPEDVDQLEIVEPRRTALGSSYGSAERGSATRTTISSIESAAQTWETRHFKKPDSLDRLLQPDGDLAPLLPVRAKTDAWGNEIQYRLNGRKVEIRSAGPDGQMFTRDDITN